MDESETSAVNTPPLQSPKEVLSPTEVPSPKEVLSPTSVPSPKEVLSPPEVPSPKKIQSPKELSIKSQNVNELSSPRLGSLQKSITPIRSPKLPSPTRSSMKDSLMPTSPPLPLKGSVQLSTKNEFSKGLSVSSAHGERKSITSAKDKEIINERDRKSTQGSELSNKLSLHLEENIVKTGDQGSNDISKSPVLKSNIDKIENMSKILTDEANALRESLKSLSENIVRTKEELNVVQEKDVNFPYHLFLIEIIINKINMKCDCFELDYNNLVIAASFLGKQPIVLYDSTYGKIEDFNHLNVGKSALFAMTYDKICTIKDFAVKIIITKQPPCSRCVSKIAETKVDYTKEFIGLREDLCKKWIEEKPFDNIMCTTSTPLTRKMLYLSCGDADHCDSIGIIELTTRMSFLGKEITTAFCASSKTRCTSVLTKEDNGMSIYACHNVEMDGQGKIILDENTLNKRDIPQSNYNIPPREYDSSISQISSRNGSAKHYRNINNVTQHHRQDNLSKYDEIYTKMNSNELRIKVPKTTKIDRMGKYDRIQELCSCEETPYNTGDQIQLELPNDVCYPDKPNNTFSSNLKYTYKNCNRTLGNGDRKIINVTPSNCPAPLNLNMEKKIHSQKDVFILKIGKKLESKDKKTDLEIELVTPKAPQTKPNENNISQQCSSNALKDKQSVGDKKKDKTKAGKKKSNETKKKKNKTSKPKKRKK